MVVRRNWVASYFSLDLGLSSSLSKHISGLTTDPERHGPLKMELKQAFPP